MRAHRLLPLVVAGAAGAYVRRVHRFRDPVRVLTAPAGDVVSPADGVVCAVRRVTDGTVAGGPAGTPVPAAALLGVDVADGWVLGIVIGPLDVHYTYQPVSGTVARVERHGSGSGAALLGPLAYAALLAGRPVDVLAGRGALENERLSVTLRGEAGDVTVTVVAPGAALDAMPYVKEGDQARAGHKLAFLPEGGVALLHVPATFTPAVSVGDAVTGLQSVVARP